MKKENHLLHTRFFITLTNSAPRFPQVQHLLYHLYTYGKEPVSHRNVSVHKVRTQTIVCGCSVATCRSIPSIRNDGYVRMQDRELPAS